MGGRALDVETQRVDAEDFVRTKAKVRRLVGEHYPETVLHFVRSYHNKPDHGDMDVLVKKGTVDKWDLVNLFDPTETYNNGDVVSLDYTSFDGVPFQLDLVFMREEWWDCAKDFFAYNDLGNLTGKIARHLRFKWGFQGLRYMAFYENNRSIKLGEFTVSRDPEQVFEFLGFDYNRFQEGFDTLEDVFEYVVNSKYFSVDAFLPENLTADQRHRDTKRKVYDHFMRYLEREAPDQRMDRWSHERAVREAESFFPEAKLREKIEAAKNRYEKRKEAKDVLDGHVLMDTFGLEGRELGAAIGKFKEPFNTDEEYHEYLLTVGRETALRDFANVNGLELNLQDV